MQIKNDSLGLHNKADPEVIRHMQCPRVRIPLTRCFHHLNSPLGAQVLARYIKTLLSHEQASQDPSFLKVDDVRLWLGQAICTM